MAKKPRRITFDTMVKYFLRDYGIPTRKDLNKIHTRIDGLENLLKRQSRRRANGRPVLGRAYKSAAEEVVDVIRGYKDGVGFAEIKKKTGFNEKKIRNIIFRMDKEGKIKRISRGLYAVSS